MTEAKMKAEQVQEYITDQLEGQPWFKRVQVGYDDHGPLVEVVVDGPGYRVSGHQVPTLVWNVKVATLMRG